MLSFIGRRLLWALLVLVAVAVLTFTLVYAVPSDPARTIAGMHASAEDVERIRQALGLDDPLPTQLLRYLARVAQGDLGHSYNQGRDVLPLVLERFPATLQLATAGIVLALLIGVPLGVLAAVRRGTWLDRLATISSVVLVSAPAFLVGYLLLYVFAFQPRMAFGVDLFPIGGYQPWDPVYLFLPALTLAFGTAAWYVRLLRTSMIDELHRDYVRTARAKGASPRDVTWGHAMRNALPLLVTQIGLDLGIYLGGVVVVENVFSWPGIGRLAVQSIVTADVPLIMGTVLFGTFFIVMANLCVDVAYMFLDPRVRVTAKPA